MKQSIKILGMAVLMGTLASPAFADSLSLTIGTPPPAPIVEAIPVAPGPEAIWAWHPGHWHWIDDRYVWIPGHYAKRPHPGAHWVPPMWEHYDHDHHGDGDYRFHPGHWE
ncbi:MAG: YXWGXW repeat-containing protein [Alphaproteobacteria bacterium]|nr:YXWGXW repeat-containing protein [Alphaproteobacteria bacterium]